MLKKTLPLLALLSTLGCDDGATEETTPAAGDDAVTFMVTISNVSDEADVPSPFAPGLWVLHEEGSPLFVEGELDSGLGLETLAEDGSPETLLESLGAGYQVGGFDAASDDYDEAAAMPGESFTFEITASPGERLSLATMFVESNDYFAGTSDTGMALFVNGAPYDGAIGLQIWDAGTEVDEPLGAGDNQPMRQEGPNSGDAEDSPVSESELTASDYILVTVTPQ